MPAPPPPPPSSSRHCVGTGPPPTPASSRDHHSHPSATLQTKEFSKHSVNAVLRTLLLRSALGINPKSLPWPRRAGSWLLSSLVIVKPPILRASAVLSSLGLKWAAAVPTSGPLHLQFLPPASSFSFTLFACLTPIVIRSPLNCLFREVPHYIFSRPPRLFFHSIFRSL